MAPKLFSNTVRRCFYHQNSTAGEQQVQWQFCVWVSVSVIIHYLTATARREALFSPAPGVFPFLLQRGIFVVRVDSPHQFGQPIRHLENRESDFHSGTNADFICSFFTLENSNTSQNHRCEITQNMYSDLHISKPLSLQKKSNLFSVPRKFGLKNSSICQCLKLIKTSHEKFVITANMTKRNHQSFALDILLL